ncbi:MAG: hypothetical protein GX308_06105 [Epulopiscium sp.]|nr:hypothetical protein [Candidatus Epulonipiscium sp.]
MKEIHINQLIELGDNYYFILGLHFTENRIMCEFIAEANQFYSSSFRSPKGIIIQDWRSSNRKVEEYCLYINGHEQKWQSGFMQYILPEYEKGILKDIKLPKCLKDKELVLIEEEFEPFCIDEEIMQIKFAKQTKERTILIQEELRVSIGKTSVPYEIDYEDYQSAKRRKLYIHNLYTVDINKYPYLKKRVELSNQIPIIAEIEVEEDIKKANLFIKKHSQGNIPLKSIEAPARKKAKREGFQYRNHYIGMTDSYDKELLLEVFSVNVKKKVEKKVIIYDKWMQPYIR